MAAIGAMQPGKTGVEVAGVEESLDGRGGVGRKPAHRSGVIVENLPDGRGAGLAGAVTNADHPERSSR